MRKRARTAGQSALPIRRGEGDIHPFRHTDARATTGRGVFLPCLQRSAGAVSTCLSFRALSLQTPKHTRSMEALHFIHLHRGSRRLLRDFGVLAAMQQRGVGMRREGFATELLPHEARRELTPRNVQDLPRPPKETSFCFQNRVLRSQCMTLTCSPKPDAVHGCSLQGGLCNTKGSCTLWSERPKEGSFFGPRPELLGFGWPLEPEGYHRTSFAFGA